MHTRQSARDSGHKNATCITAMNQRQKNLSCRTSVCMLAYHPTVQARRSARKEGSTTPTTVLVSRAAALVSSDLTLVFNGLGSGDSVLDGLDGVA